MFSNFLCELHIHLFFVEDGYDKYMMDACCKIIFAISNEYSVLVMKSFQ